MRVSGLGFRRPTKSRACFLVCYMPLAAAEVLPHSFKRATHQQWHAGHRSERYRTRASPLRATFCTVGHIDFIAGGARCWT